MTKKLDHRFWAKYFKVYDVLNMVIPYQELLDAIVKELDVKKGDVILDAGCGTGNLAVKLKAKGAKVFGIDYCIEALDVYKLKDPDAEVMVHDLTQPLPFPDKYFDKIASNNVIYAIPKSKREDAIKELHRVLKNNGMLVIVNPKIGFNNVNIFKDHLKKDSAQSGNLKLTLEIVKYFPKILKMFYYNYLLKQNGQSSSINSFFKLKEQLEIFGVVGFSKIEEIDVYSNESLLVKGVK